MNGSICVVDCLLRIAEDEASAGLFARIVPSVGLCEREAVRERGIALRNPAGIVEGLACVAAVGNIWVSRCTVLFPC